ncbi:MAG: hypothetical protein WDO24_17970 [Pseudomonadota bacterium]
MRRILSDPARPGDAGETGVRQFEIERRQALKLDRAEVENLDRWQVG